MHVCWTLSRGNDWSLRCPPFINSSCSCFLLDCVSFKGRRNCLMEINAAFIQHPLSAQQLHSTDSSWSTIIQHPMFIFFTLQYKITVVIQMLLFKFLHDILFKGYLQTGNVLNELKDMNELSAIMKCRRVLMPVNQFLTSPSGAQRTVCLHCCCCASTCLKCWKPWIVQEHSLE